MNSDDKKIKDTELTDKLDEIEEELVDIAECFHEATISSSEYLRREAQEKKKANI